MTKMQIQFETIFALVQNLFSKHKSKAQTIGLENSSFNR